MRIENLTEFKTYFKIYNSEVNYETYLDNYRYDKI